MRTNIFASLIGLALMSNSFATGIPDYPFDVEEFIDRREICDHFRGEEPYDADRAKFLTEQIMETCTGTDNELQKLKQKYKDNDDILQLLNGFEEEIESTGES
jgi:hypothetical protein